MPLSYKFTVFSSLQPDMEIYIWIRSGFLAEAENPPHVWKARSFPNFGDLGQPGGGSFLSQTESGSEVTLLPRTHYSHIYKIRACQISWHSCSDPLWSTWIIISKGLWRRQRPPRLTSANDSIYGRISFQKCYSHYDCHSDDILYVLLIFGNNPFAIIFQRAKLDKHSNLSDYDIIICHVPRYRGLSPARSLKKYDLYSFYYFQPAQCRLASD